MFACRIYGASLDRESLMKFENKLMYYFVRDALRTYSDDFVIIDYNNPIQIELNGYKYSIHVSYVHDSGNTRPNDDERRIQISRDRIDNQKYHLENSFRTAFLGFFEDGKVFVAWDPRHVYSLKAETVVSVYARQSQAKAAVNNFSAVHEFTPGYLKKTIFTIALQSQTLGFYLENIESFHSLSSAKNIDQMMGKFKQILSESWIGKSDDVDFGENGERRKFSFVRKSYPRDPIFRCQVMDAYEHACCVCGRQLGLVQAAHIIPHSVLGSPTSVNNGLALCVEHHHLYDDGLLLPGPDNKLMFNSNRADYLVATKQGKGLEKIAELHNCQYSVPEDPNLRPLDKYLEKGLRFRV